MRVFNTKTKSLEEFKPLKDKEVLLYTCGPTVYNYLHVGNWVAYIRWDVLVRTLQANGYNVKRVMNITDVGHLVSDADDGEDKMEKGAKREGKTAWEVAKIYTDDFLSGTLQLNLIEPTYITKATDFINEQIALVQKLDQKGYTYVIDDGVYFDTSKFDRYADFANLNLDEIKQGARVEYNSQKKNPSDFALWKFSPKNEKRDMQWWAHWQSPNNKTSEKHISGASHADVEQGVDEQRTEPYTKYGEGVAKNATQLNAASSSGVASSAGQQGAAVSGSWGFPGWHLECSAMALAELGDTIDIHTGGIDHIPVHHTNEIAQSECATGKTFANYWLHNNFLLVDGTKVSKSIGNTYTLQDLAGKGFSANDFRMFVLQSHYRSESNFTWENLKAAKNRLKNWQQIACLKWQATETSTEDKGKTLGDESPAYLNSAKNILSALNNDLDTPAALVAAEEGLSYAQTNGVSPQTLNSFNKLLDDIENLTGLQITASDITNEQKTLINSRQEAREAKDYTQADQIREKLEGQGIEIKDTSRGQIWYRC